jgi:hypothetical protein
MNEWGFIGMDTFVVLGKSLMALVCNECFTRANKKPAPTCVFTINGGLHFYCRFRKRPALQTFLFLSSTCKLHSLQKSAILGRSSTFIVRFPIKLGMTDYKRIPSLQSTVFRMVVVCGLKHQPQSGVIPMHIRIPALSEFLTGAINGKQEKQISNYQGMSQSCFFRYDFFIGRVYCV